MSQDGADGVGATTQEALRKLWRQHFRSCRKLWDAWEASGFERPPPASPPFPEVLRGLTCGATTRAGTPCKLTALYSSARCKLHGGLSTGPKTAKGKKKAAKNGKNPKQKRTP